LLSFPVVERRCKVEWRNWTDLGGDLKSGATPSLAEFVRRDLTLVARMDNGRVGMTGRSTAGWFAWQDLGFACQDKPAVAFSPRGLVVAARGTDGGLWIGGFQQWTPSGGSLSSAPAVASWWLDPNVEIFARGSDGTLLWFTFSNFGAATANLPPDQQRISGAPAAVAPGPNGIHVFARRDGDSRLIHAMWNYRSWSAWTDLGEVITSSPCAVSRDINQVEVYFADAGGVLARRQFTVGAGGALVDVAARQVVAPVALGDPAAVSFGPWHVEVFQRQADGTLGRVYAEGGRSGDDVGLDAGSRLASAPALSGRARSVMHCAVRSVRDELLVITSEDGYWGQWRNLGGFLDSDPVVVTASGGGAEVVARDNNQQITHWSGFDVNWSGPVKLPALPAGWCVGRPQVFADGSGGFRILTRTSADHLLEAVIAPGGAFQRWSDIPGLATTQQPALVRVAANELPAPFPGMVPPFALTGGVRVVLPDANGTLQGRLFDGSGWGPWQVFSTRVTRVRRPFPVTKVGTNHAFDSSLIGNASQAGWIGRAPDGSIQQQRMVWVRMVGAGVVAVVLDSTNWTPSPTWIDLAADPTGLQVPEPHQATPGNPDVLVTHLFGRSPQGHVRWLPTANPEPGQLGWEWVGRDYRIAGDVGAQSLWNRYENLSTLCAAAVTTGRSLVVGVAGIGPAPIRIQPRPTILTLPRPPRPVHPVRPPRPRPFP
jgi:hypothetical protein